MGIWNSISALNGKTLVNIVGEIWDAGLGLVNKIKSGLSDFADKVKDGVNYIAKAAFDAIFNGIEAVSKNFIYGFGKILEVFIPNLEVVSSDFVYFNKDGNSDAYGIKKQGDDLAIKLGSFLTLDLIDIFIELTEISFSGNAIQFDAGEADLGSNLFSNWFEIPPNHQFLSIAWEYIKLELLKELYITIGFTLVKALQIAQRPALAVATFIGLLVYGLITSNNILNMIKSDPSLNPDSRKATIFQLFNIQLDFAMGNLVDMAMELYADKTDNPNDDYTRIGFAFDAALNPLQGLIGSWIFNSWANIDPIWDTSIIDNAKIGLLEVVLTIAGGMQMSYLFDSSVKAIEKLTKILTGIVNLPGISSISTSLLTGLMGYKESISLYKFGYTKYFYGFGLSAYHSLNMYLWANSINSI